MFLFSVRTRSNFSPARNVLSTTAPEPSDFSFVRTNAPPLPGLTCWNSTMRQTPPSSWMCIPFLNWFVLTVSATRPSLANDYELLRRRREDLGGAVRDDDEILDPDAAALREVDTGLARDDVAGGERLVGVLIDVRQLVHEEADAVTEPVAEGLAETRLVDDAARGTVGVGRGRPRTDGGQPRGLRLVADPVRNVELVGKRPGGERPRAI